MSADLIARIERIEAHGAIADLVHAYARAVRRERYEEVAELFVAGGSFEVRAGQPDRAAFTVRQRFDSPEALVAFLVAGRGRGRGRPHPVPLIHNLMIEVAGDIATANAMMAAPILGTDREVLGEYQDSFVREASGWKFSARVYTVFEGN